MKRRDDIPTQPLPLDRKRVARVAAKETPAKPPREQGSKGHVQAEPEKSDEEFSH